IQEVTAGAQALNTTSFARCSVSFRIAATSLSSAMSVPRTTSRSILFCRRPGRATLMIEIKCTTQVTPKMVNALNTLGRRIDQDAELVLLSADPIKQDIEGVRCLPWQAGLLELFTLTI